MRSGAEELLDAFRIADARKLDDDAGVAFGTDLGVGHASRVNAPADDVDGLLDCGERSVVQSDGRQGHGDGAGVGETMSRSGVLSAPSGEMRGRRAAMASWVLFGSTSWISNWLWAGTT